MDMKTALRFSFFWHEILEKFTLKVKIDLRIKYFWNKSIP